MIHCGYFDTTRKGSQSSDFWHQQWLVGDAPFPVKYSSKVTHHLRKTPTSQHKQTCSVHVLTYNNCRQLHNELVGRRHSTKQSHGSLCHSCYNLHYPQSDICCFRAMTLSPLQRVLCWSVYSYDCILPRCLVAIFVDRHCKLYVLYSDNENVSTLHALQRFFQVTVTDTIVSSG